MNDDDQQQLDGTAVRSDGVVHFASASEILGVSDTYYEVVEVPEWKTAAGTPFSVRMRGLTGQERDSWEGTNVRFDKRGRQQVNLNQFRARLIVRSAVDGDGNRLFTDSDAVHLSQKSAAGLQRLFEVAQRLSGLSDEDVDEMTKDSGGAQTEHSQNGAAGFATASPTASP